MTPNIELERVALFEALESDELELVSRMLEYRNCPAETRVVEAGSSDRSLYVVYSGSVRIVKSTPEGESAIAEILPGQHLGEVTFIDGGERTATAIANEQSELLVIDPRRFEELGQAAPAVAFKITWSILRLLSRRLRSTDFWLFSLMETGAKVQAD